MNTRQFQYIKKLLSNKNVRYMVTGNNKIEVFNQSRHCHVATED